ncbi:MAG: S9 family peptidase [Bacteroidales bacterium]|nr:S9 family peptidase [Bacteroidales bacterium]
MKINWLVQFSLSTILFFNVQHSLAQKKNFTFEDIETGRKTTFQPPDIQSRQWIAGSDDAVFVKNDTLYSVNSNTGNVNRVFTIGEVNYILNGLKLSKVDEMPVVQFVSKDQLYFTLTGNEFLFYDLKNKHKKLVKLPSNAEEISYNSELELFVFTIDNNLYYQQDELMVEITRDTNQWVVNGKAVHRVEFGIEEGYYWSPDKTKIAYYKNDQRSVSRYPLVETNNEYAKVNMIPYPMAGMKSEEVSVWVYSFEDRNSVELEIGGNPEQYLTNITWNLNGDKIYIQQLNRSQDTMKIKVYDATSGRFKKEIYQEVDKRYVEPQHHLLFFNHENDFYYLSRKDGYFHVYRYLSGKGKMKQVTSGNWEVLENLGVDKEQRFLYFIATKESAMEQHLYRLELKNGKYTKLTNEPGVHEVILNGDKSKFIDEFSNTETSRKISVVNIEEKKNVVLVEPVDLLSKYHISEPEYGTLKAADNKTDLNYRLVKPLNMEEGKKYPVIVYVYGGSHVQLLRNEWAGRVWFWQQYMAQQGFATFILDCRGSSNRGKDFEDVVHRKNGIPQLADQMKGVEFLQSLTYVDTSRIGVHGWSFGGYMTMQMMLKENDIFKVGVAGGPVTNWEYYEVMYGERYMDTPGKNPEGYKETNLANYVDQLKGKLLIIHGAQDPVVLMQHTMQFVRACIESNKRPDLFIYPTHEHNVSGKDREHLVEMISKYFMEHL